MKKVFLIVTFVLISAITFAKKVPGKIIYKSGDTVQVVFDVPFNSEQPDFEEIQFRVDYYTAANEHKVLKPKQAAELRFSEGGQEFIMLSRPNTIESFSNARDIFLHLRVDGNLKLFVFYFAQHYPGTSFLSGGARQNYVLQKGDGYLLQPGSLNFRKHMIGYLPECPELERRIDDKELKYEDLELIVREYNKKCAQ